MNTSYHVHELVVAAEDARHLPARVELDGQVFVHVPLQVRPALRHDVSLEVHRALLGDTII